MERIMFSIPFTAGIAAGQSPGTGFTITSDAFREQQSIPAKYAHGEIKDGRNISLPFRWTGAPAGTRSFALSIVDPHPVAKNWVHWIIVNIPPDVTSVAEGAGGTQMPAGSLELENTYGERGYGGPEPPRGSGVHPYVVTLYALDVEKLNLKPRTSLREFQAALDGKVIGQATTTGMFEQR